MKRKIAYAISAAIIASAGFGSGIAASASGGTPLSHEWRTETIINGHCYVTDQVTETYWHWSSTHGWERYPAARVSTVHSETCH